LACNEGVRLIDRELALVGLADLIVIEGNSGPGEAYTESQRQRVRTYRHRPPSVHACHGAGQFVLYRSRRDSHRRPGV
jgi:hypothetical protein